MSLKLSPRSCGTFLGQDDDPFAALEPALASHLVLDLARQLPPAPGDDDDGKQAAVEMPIAGRRAAMTLVLYGVERVLLENYRRPSRGKQERVRGLPIATPERNPELNSCRAERLDFSDQRLRRRTGGLDRNLDLHRVRAGKRSASGSSGSQPAPVQASSRALLRWPDRVPGFGDGKTQSWLPCARALDARRCEARLMQAVPPNRSQRDTAVAAAVCRRCPPPKRVPVEVVALGLLAVGGAVEAS